jgi:hypothetical protein
MLWRGAASQDGSSIGWLQAAPGSDPGHFHFYLARTNPGVRRKFCKPWMKHTLGHFLGTDGRDCPYR